MTKLCIADTLIETERPLKEFLHDLNQKLNSEGRIIHKITVGQDVYWNYDDVPVACVDNDVVVVSISSLSDYMLELQTDAAVYCGKVIDACGKVADLCTANRIKEAAEVIADLALAVSFLISTACTLSQHQTTTADFSLNEILSELDRTANDLCESFQSADYVAVSDCLIYELTPVLKRLQTWITGETAGFDR